MPKKRRQFTADYKFKVALEAAKGTKRLAHLTSELGVRANQISQWKAQLLDSGAKLFERGGETTERQLRQREAELYEQIGRLKMDLEWLKRRSLDEPREERSAMGWTRWVAKRYPHHPHCRVIFWLRATGACRRTWIGHEVPQRQSG
jgi:transposase-like protein